MLLSPTRVASVHDMESMLWERLETLSSFAGSTAVARKFTELGKQPDAEPSEYVKVISADSVLSSRVLALANSAWFGVRHRITRIAVAVNLLGLSAVRTLAISFCLKGLHGELKLTAEIARHLWMASLWKGIAARKVVEHLSPEQSDEAFFVGLLQDMALPLMASIAPDEMGGLLHDYTLDLEARVAAEREMFRLDHAEVGRAMAQKMGLPEFLVDAIGFHHSPPMLRGALNNDALTDGVLAAALFPHAPCGWNPGDGRGLQVLLRSQPVAIEFDRFVQAVEDEFARTYRMFESSDPPHTLLTA